MNRLASQSLGTRFKSTTTQLQKPKYFTTSCAPNNAINLMAVYLISYY